MKSATHSLTNIGDLNSEIMRFIEEGVVDRTLTSSDILKLMNSAATTVRVMGWLVGYLLNYIETAIAENRPEFRKYMSISDWFDEFEEALPFKRSMAKTYKAMATAIDLTRFSQIGPRKLNVILKVKDDTQRERLIDAVIKRNLNESRIREAVNQALLKETPTEDPIHEEEKIVQPTGNMYELSKAQWNPFKGCDFDCLYCRESFQRMEKRDAHGCADCLAYRPHAHAEALTKSLPATGYMEFIFTCASGDIAFCDDEYLSRIVARIQNETDKSFLLQSKNPATFHRIRFPRNVILGTTLETTNDVGYDRISQAPPPSLRFRDFLTVNHPAKMVTLEPLIEFDLDIMVSWIEELRPRFIWIGLDSKNCLSRKHGIAEPSIEKVLDLYRELGSRGHLVMLKKEAVKRIWNGR